MVLRGDEIRALQLRNICLMDMTESEGVQRGKMLVLMDQGNLKTNSVGRLDIAACMRYRTNPFLCSHFGLGLFYFMRWRVSGFQTPTSGQFSDQTAAVCTIFLEL